MMNIKKEEFAKCKFLFFYNDPGGLVFTVQVVFFHIFMIIWFCD